MKLLLSADTVQIILKDIRTRAGALIDGGVSPHVAVLLVGEDPASVRYVDIKTRRAEENGVTLSTYLLEADTPRPELVEILDHLSADDEIHGIIVQLPLPGVWSDAELDTLFSHIDPSKDVDGLRGDWVTTTEPVFTVQALLGAKDGFVPPMVASVCSLLDAYAIPLKDKKTVVVGRGRLVGKPIEAYLRKAGYDIQTVDEETDGILDITQSADILIAGTGTPDIVTYQWIKPDAVVLDCADDVHRDSVDQVASAVAPAKGGLGPLTVAWLLHNVVRAAENH